MSPATLRLPDPKAPRLDAWGTVSAKGGMSDVIAVDVNQHVTRLRLTIVGELGDPVGRHQCWVVYYPAEGGATVQLYRGSVQHADLGVEVTRHIHGRVLVTLTVDAGEPTVAVVVTVVHTLEPSCHAEST